MIRIIVLVAAMINIAESASASLPQGSSSISNSSNTTPSSSLQSSSSHNIAGCQDNSPFLLTHEDWWKCNSSLLDCYANVTQTLAEYIDCKDCKNKTCLISKDQKYQSALQKTLNPQNNTSCSNIKWTDAMDITANIVIQRAQRCQLDYATLFKLAETVNSLIAMKQSCRADDGSDTSSSVPLQGILQATQSNSTSQGSTSQGSSPSY